MHKDILADKLTEERFFVDSTVRGFHIYVQRTKRLPIVMQQSQFMCYALIELDKQLVHKLVWLHKTRG